MVQCIIFPYELLVSSDCFYDNFVDVHKETFTFASFETTRVNYFMKGHISLNFNRFKLGEPRS